jgi:hypothetical protein
MLSFFCILAINNEINLKLFYECRSSMPEV